MIANSPASTDLPEPSFLCPRCFFVQRAIQAAQVTDGTFSPVLGRPLASFGYDRTWEEGHPDVNEPVTPLPIRRNAWRDVRLDARRQTIQCPPGVAFALGGIAKGTARGLTIPARCYPTTTIA